jgi:proliferating cell nuclear antigen
MRLKLDNPKILVDVVSIISELVTEVKIKVTKEGLSATAIDPANVAMAYFKIPAELFSEFSLTHEHVLGVNLEHLKAVMRRCKPGAALVIERADNLLHLSIADRIKRDFSLALLDITGDDKEMPVWEFNSVIKLSADALAEVVEDCLIVSDACTFTAEPNKFIVEAKGLNAARAEFSSDEIEIHSGNSRARFSLDYLNKFIKGAKISDRVVVNFSQNHPMRLDFLTGNVLLSFVLAPRIEQED